MTRPTRHGIITETMDRTAFRKAFMPTLLFCSVLFCLSAQSADNRQETGQGASSGSTQPGTAPAQDPASAENAAGTNQPGTTGDSRPGADPVRTPGEIIEPNGNTPLPQGPETSGTQAPEFPVQGFPDSGPPEPRRTAENVLSGYPFAILYGIFSVSYERKLNDLLSLEAGPFFRLWAFGLNPAVGNPLLFFSWYGARLGILVYPGQVESDGLFLGAMVRPSYIVLFPEQKGSSFCLGFGIFAGYRFRFGNFAVAPRAGFSYDEPMDPAFSGANYSNFPFQGIVFEWDVAFSWIF